MKSADMARKEIAFIQWDIPAKKQTELLPDILHGNSARLDRGNIVITSLGITAHAQVTAVRNNEPASFHTLDDTGEMKSIQNVAEYSNLEGRQRVGIQRTILIKLLEAMTSDRVDLYVSENRPLFLAGLVGERDAAAWIAPVIVNEEEDE